MNNKWNEKKVSAMREGGHVLARIVDQLGKFTVVGQTTMDIEEECSRLLKEFDVKSSFLGFEGYKYNSCLSVNDTVIHGLPSKENVLNAGDIIKIDLGIFHKGYHTDHARTFIVGEKTSLERKKLVDTTKLALDKALEVVKSGVLVNRISKVIEETANMATFTVVRDFAGHGVGERLHMNPDVLCYYLPEQTDRLVTGMTIAIEPMINVGTHRIYIYNDGWSVKTADKKDSALFEHTVLVLEDGCEILTKID